MIGSRLFGSPEAIMSKGRAGCRGGKNGAALRTPVGQRSRSRIATRDDPTAPSQASSSGSFKEEE